MTGLRSFITRTDYQSVYGGKDTVGEIPERVEISHLFISQPNELNLAVLCSADGTWIWVNKSMNPDPQWSVWGTIVADNESVTLVQLFKCEK